MVMYTCSARHAAVNTGQVPVLTPALLNSGFQTQATLSLSRVQPQLVSTDSLFNLSASHSPGPVSLPHPPASPSVIPASPIQPRVFWGRSPSQPREGCPGLVGGNRVFSHPEHLFYSTPARVHVLDAQLPVVHAEPPDAGQGADYSADLHGHFAGCEDHVHRALSALDSLPRA